MPKAGGSWHSEGRAELSSQCPSGPGDGRLVPKWRWLSPSYLGWWPADEVGRALLGAWAVWLCARGEACWSRGESWMALGHCQSGHSEGPKSFAATSSQFGEVSGGEVSPRTWGIRCSPDPSWPHTVLQLSVPPGRKVFLTWLPTFCK